ncbi:DUF2953 domain-containing protein [Virgibacillus sediminis]|uniref:DUF2953 domain-containing protein n=1 Tax=Virgibacillus sediminis TaxID=202260 RepID=A0ABV7A747_9BACI
MVYLSLAILFILLILLLFSRIYITVNYTYSGNGQLLSISVLFLRLRVFSRDITREKREDNDWLDSLDHLVSGSFSRKVKEMLNITMDVSRYLYAILKNMHFHQLKWYTKGGTGDAASTGMLAGGAWSVKGALIGMIAEFGRLECEPDIQVIPIFQGREMSSTIDCMVSMRTGKTILALLKAKRIISKKNKKKSQKEE